MTDGELVSMGEFCSRMLTNDDFNLLVAEFERSGFQQFTSTKPGQSKEREEVYAGLYGLSLFLGFMGDFVQQRERILNPTPQDDGE